MKIHNIVELKFLRTILKQFFLANGYDYSFSFSDTDTQILEIQQNAPDFIIVQESYSDRNTAEMISSFRMAGIKQDIFVILFEDRPATEDYKRLRQYKKLHIINKQDFPSILKNFFSSRALPSGMLTNFHEESKKILVVDDSQMIHEIISSNLGARYDLFHAMDGESALEMYNRILPDLILTDIEMPGITGLELCRTIKSANRKRYIPIIVISSHNRPLDIDTAFNYGADDYITKPINPAELLEKVDEFMLSIERRKQNKVLVVDDDKLVREILRHAFLTNGLNVLTSSSAEEAFQFIVEQRPEIVITDIVMPGMSGYELCQKINSYPELCDIKLLMMSGKDEPCDIKRAERLGVRRYFTKPFDPEKIIIVVEQLLNEKYLLYKHDSENMLASMNALITALEARDTYTRGHSLRVAWLAVKLAEYMHLDSSKVETIRVAAQLHDIGKIGIRDRVLFKTGKLDNSEYAQIREHAVIGAEILRPINMLKSTIPLILFHHERWDGSGYPVMIKGSEIPLGARVLAIADTFDAMTSTRPYRESLTVEQALAEISGNLGTQFCPEVGGYFLEMVRVDPKAYSNEEITKSCGDGMFYT